MKRLALFLLCALFLFSAPAVAKMYKWRDAKGVLHYSQEPPVGLEVETYHELTRPESAYKKPPAVTTSPDSEPDVGRSPAPAEPESPKHRDAVLAFSKILDVAQTVEYGVVFKEYRPMVRTASMAVSSVKDRARRSALSKIVRLYETAETCWYNDIFNNHAKFSKTGNIKYNLYSTYSIIADSWESCRQKCWRKGFEMVRDYDRRFQR
jgi:hypothetical protein